MSKKYKLLDHIISRVRNCGAQPKAIYMHASLIFLETGQFLLASLSIKNPCSNVSWGRKEQKQIMVREWVPPRDTENDISIQLCKCVQSDVELNHHVTLRMISVSNCANVCIAMWSWTAAWHWEWYEYLTAQMCAERWGAISYSYTIHPFF